MQRDVVNKRKPWLCVTVPAPPGPLPPAAEMWTLLCDIGDALRWEGDLRDIPVWLSEHRREFPKPQEVTP